MALYSDKVMDHFKNPRNVGEIPDADGVGEVGNAKCGDIMKMYLKIKDNVIEDVKFETFGCGSAIASSSMATEMIKGKTIEEALAVSNKEVVEALDGLPAHKLHCSVLAEEAIKTAVKDYYDKNNIPYDHSRFPDCENCGSCHLVCACQKSIFDKLSNETHFVGLSFEGAAARRSALAYARTFASRKVFLPTYTPPAKMLYTLFAPAGANSARLF